MRPLRRLLARTLLAPFLLLPLLSCGYARPSAKVAVAAITRTGSFAEPRLVRIPRRIEARTRDEVGGGALDDRQLASIDPVVAILHANRIIELKDVYGPDGVTGGYLHILTIWPAADQPADLFIETDQPYGGPMGWASIRKTPGWHLNVGRREVVTVWQILDPNSPNAERLAPGYVQVEFGFRWIPTEIGKLFDQGAIGFDDLPNDLQRAAAQAAALNSRETYGGRAWMTRDKKGEWMVTLFDCRRCDGPQV
jgi:hypothetical protein